MEKSKDFFDSWLKAQEGFTRNWFENSYRLQQSLIESSDGKNLGDYMKFNRTWSNSVLNALNGVAGSNINVIKDTLFKTFSSSNVYARLYELWVPIFNAIKDKNSSAECYRELLDPVKYKEVLDNCLGFDPKAMAEFYAQSSKLMELMLETTKGYMNPWSEAAQKNLGSLPLLVEGRPESFINVFHNMFNAFENTYGNIFHIPAVGKDREKIELIMKGFDDISVFMAKNTEYQHMMYVTGLTAMENVIGTIAEKIKEGSEVKDFGEFFNLWIDVNEKAYYALFQTPDFSKVQSEMVETSLKVRTHFFKLTELYLYDFPVAVRSEMDDLYKTVYDLKKKIKHLEKQVKTSVSEEA